MRFAVTAILAGLWLALPQAAQAITDCNGNGIDDATDIANGAADCNNNGIPDVCESTYAVDSSTAAPGAPFGLNVADFDGDGNNDLVYVDRDGNRLVVAFSDSAGKLTSTAFTTGQAPVWLAVADFNGDHKPDVAVVDSGGDDVSIFLNTGQSGQQVFPATGVTYPTDLTPSFIVAVDIDGDGDQDLVVTQDGSQSARIFLNDGHGVFTKAANDQETGFGPVAIATGDFDGNGLPDLAIANETSNNLTVILTNVQTPPPNTTADFNSPAFLAAGDFDKDGFADLAIANFGSSKILILHSSHDGSFTVGQELTGVANPVFILAKDVDNDGNLDLLVTGITGMGTDTQSSVALFKGHGDGTFSLFTQGTVPAASINSLVFASLAGAAPIAALDDHSLRILRILSQGPTCSGDNGGGDTTTPPTTGGCGAGACGSGSASMVPLTLAGLMLMRVGGGTRNDRRSTLRKRPTR